MSCPIHACVACAGLAAGRLGQSASLTVLAPGEELRVDVGRAGGAAGVGWQDAAALLKVSSLQLGMQVCCCKAVPAPCIEGLSDNCQVHQLEGAAGQRPLF